MSSYTNSNFDSLLLQSLMGRLQLRPPNSNSPNSNSFLNQSLEDFLLNSEIESDDELESGESKTQLSKEESKLEKDIIKVILSGKGDTLKPNSGQAVTVGEHHICVGYHQESGSDYRVWEWHGHIMLFDEENGYTPEYIYGNYFERPKVGSGSSAAAEEIIRGLRKKKEEVEEEEEEEEEEDEEEKVGNLGLRELIDGGDSSTGGCRILHRNSMNVPGKELSPAGILRRAQDLQSRRSSEETLVYEEGKLFSFINPTC
ncbi:hypothetical protein MKW94_016619 [Papaver nudicaule]|uniref:Uncharacterized protein n=1 Tax=Papaver nudicaule TaxID=74823 RepID=A0AA41SEK4_PAPNU|nr:hypothetical protein [Papaver nudicaule]